MVGTSHFNCTDDIATVTFNCVPLLMIKKEITAVINRTQASRTLLQLRNFAVEKKENLSSFHCGTFFFHFSLQMISVAIFCFFGSKQFYALALQRVVPLRHLALPKTTVSEASFS